MRYVSIDLLRTVAIVMMVLVHFMENLAGSNWGVAGFGAPIFNFLVGVSYRVWLDSQEKKDIPEETIFRISLRRGLFLFVLGLAFNVFVWLPEDAFNWDVLTLIGTALLLLNFLRQIPTVISIVISLTAMVIGPFLREITDYPAYWTNGYFECDWTFSEIVMGYLSNGYFPIFPWIAYPLMGFVIASVLFEEESTEHQPTATTALIGIIMMLVTLLAVIIGPQTPMSITKSVLRGWTMFPPSIEYVMGTLGMAIMAFSLCHRWIDRAITKEPISGLLSICTTLSKYSLSMYLFHHVVHIWPLWIYGAIYGTEPTQFWRNAMPMWPAIGLAVLCLVLGCALFRWMERTKRPGLESLMRYLCG
ncbi:MAG: DUF1624 domain-containing protein [Planctomycetia bacterium]|nr:DUF1624 domain-containing protein [Planctomycetia bacterium]